MKKIDEMLGITGVEEPTYETLPNIIEDETSQDFIKDEINDFEEDFDRSIEILSETLEVSRDSLSSLADLARDDENVKAYDSINNFLKTMNQTAKLILDLHEKKQKFKQASNKKSNDAERVGAGNVTTNNTQVNNNYFGKIEDIEKEFLSNNPELIDVIKKGDFNK